MGAKALEIFFLFYLFIYLFLKKNCQALEIFKEEVFTSNIREKELEPSDK